MLSSFAAVLRVSLNVIGWVKLSLISVTEQIFGKPQRMRLQRQLYGISSVMFLTFMIPFCLFYVKSFTKRLKIMCKMSEEV